MCRGEFSELGELIVEIALSDSDLKKENDVKRRVNPLISNIKRDFEMSGEHCGVCVDCNCSPIIGRLYCIAQTRILEEVDEAKLLCSRCFGNRINGCVQENLFYFWKNVRISVPYTSKSVHF